MWIELAVWLIRLICFGLLLRVIIAANARPQLAPPVCPRCRERMAGYHVTDGFEKWVRWRCADCNDGDQLGG